MVIVAMGVSGSGKSHFGEALAGALGWDFQEGDALHPPENVAKMREGIPLDDGDRTPWLDRVAAWIAGELDAGRGGVVSCSALKRAYRDRLRVAGGVVRGDVRFVYLRVPRDELARRMAARQHFMPLALLDSQLAALEEPGEDEGVLVLDGVRPVEKGVAAVRAWLAGALPSAG